MNTYDKELTTKELLAIKDENIDTSDIPEVDENFWKKAKLVKAENKKAISLRVNSSTLDWYKKQTKNKGYQKLMNAVLDSYVQSHKNNSEDHHL